MVATRRTTTTTLQPSVMKHTVTDTSMTSNNNSKNNSNNDNEDHDLLSTIHSLLQDRRNLHKLEYTIHSSSGHSVGYSPDRILEDNPEDQASRWSSSSNDQNQFVMLKLAKPALLATITFGKFNKLHVCNLREFLVLAGPHEEAMVPVLHSGLRNDTEPETFTVKNIHRHPTMFIPCRFVKIVPLASHGSNFNFSIWYVELRGVVEDRKLLDQIAVQWQANLDREAWRLCLDFIRRHADPDTKVLYKRLSERVGVKIEDDHLRRLFEAVTADPDCDDLEEAERLIVDMPDDLFTATNKGNPRYTVQWTAIKSTPWPCQRGGHQMVWDEKGGLLWLFGGWDGEGDLGDLWSFHPSTSQWQCLQQDARHHGGPSPRSCHKLAMDQTNRKLYVLGRFVEPDQRAHQPLNSELYCFDCQNGQWTCLSEDTAQDGGPLLLYDHQMIVTGDGRLWVYGGKVVSASPSEPVYSGLWVCNLHDDNAETPRWRLVRPDDPSLSDLKATPMLRSRIGHCMLFDEESRLLHILHGQRMKDYLSDYYQYNIDTDTVVHYEKDVSARHGPPPGFTQRGCLVSPEPGRKMLLLLSGLVRENRQPGHDGSTASATNYDSTQNALWALDLPTNYSHPHLNPADGWSCLYSNNESDASYWNRMRDQEPCPRYAHQLVACGDHGVYLFGGNPGDVSNPRARLNDMWRCAIVKSGDVVSVKRHIVYLIRRQQYKEMCKRAHQCKASAVDALRYLQTKVASVVSPPDAPDFERLSKLLFTTTTTTTTMTADGNGHGGNGGDRIELYEQIAKMFAEDKRPPSCRLQDYLL